jgi:autoinducer 2 (AI-2) kinase
MSDYFLTLDAGTSGGKCAIIDEKGKFRSIIKTAWSYVSVEELEPYGFMFYPDQFWQILLRLMVTAIGRAKISPSDIIGIAATSQRHGCVFLDSNGMELYAGPNRDARGLEVDIEDYFDPVELYKITGHGPPFILPLARLLWFQENEEEIFEQIKHLLTIDGWVNFKLTGKYTIHDSAAAETMLFDIRKRTWSETIMDECDIPNEILPERYPIGAYVGDVTEDVVNRLNLKSKTPVMMAPADTQVSLLGCGAYQKGDLGIVAGSTMPIQLIVDQAMIDGNQQIWTGAFTNTSTPLWVIESNAGAAGDIHDWFIDRILKPIKAANPYGTFEKLALSQPPGSRGVLADLGVQIFQAQRMLSIPTGGGFSFLPIAYSFDVPIDIASLARALLENLAFAVRANIKQIKSMSNYSISNTYMVGGLAKSKAFAQVLSNVINTKIKVPNQPEGALLGCAIAGMLGLDRFTTLRDAIETLITGNHMEYIPEEDQIKPYNELFPQWLQFYQQSRPDDETT